MRFGANLLAAGVIAVGLAATAPQAQASIIDFSGNICGGPCGNYSLIDANYGSGGGATVSYDRNIGNGIQAGDRLSWWDSYSGLPGVAWGDPGAIVQMFISPDVAGTAITLNSFNLGSYVNANRTTQVTIRDGLNNILYSSGQFTVGATPFTFSTPIVSTTGIAIQWGPDGYDVGIDNINFTVSAVPEPATWAMMLVGFAGLGFAARRRKAMAL